MCPVKLRAERRDRWARWSESAQKMSGGGSRVKHCGQIMCFCWLFLCLRSARWLCSVSQGETFVCSRDFMGYFWDLVPFQQDVGGWKKTPNMLYLLSYCIQWNQIFPASLICELMCCKVLIYWRHSFSLDQVAWKTTRASLAHCSSEPRHRLLSVFTTSPWLPAFQPPRRLQVIPCQRRHWVKRWQRLIWNILATMSRPCFPAVPTSCLIYGPRLAAVRCVSPQT